MGVVPATDSLNHSRSMSDMASNSTYETTAPPTPDRSSSFSPIYPKGIDSQSPAALKSEEYRQLFRLPPDEVLVQDFNCALQENILLQGHMYIFTNYVCFYSNIFGFETKKIIHYRDISDVKRAKTAGIFSNAIEIYSGEKRHFFASFLSRDEAFKLIEDGCLQSGQTNASTEKQENGIIFETIQAVSNDELGSSNRDETFSPSNVMQSSTEIENDSVIVTESHREEVVGDMDLVDNGLKDVIRSSKCLNWHVEDTDAPEISTSHTRVAEAKFPIKVKKFFDLFFSDVGVDFVQEFHARCKDKDFKCSSWIPDDKLGHMRNISFQHPIKIYFGSKCGCCHEVQKFRVYRNSHLIIETSQDITDVPYSDYFCVQGLWDVTRDAEGSKEGCVLNVYVNVAFTKNTVFKGKIVKSTLEECRETYALWIEMAHDVLKEKNLDKQATEGNAAIVEANTEGDVLNRLQVTNEHGKATQISDLHNTTHGVGIVESRNIVSCALEECTKKVSWFLRNQSPLSLILFIAFVAIILMQVSILVLLSRPPTVSMAGFEGHNMGGMSRGSPESVAWLERRMHHLKDELQLLEAHLHRLHQEHRWLISQLKGYDKIKKKSI